MTVSTHGENALTLARNYEPRRTVPACAAGDDPE